MAYYWRHAHPNPDCTNTQNLSVADMNAGGATLAQMSTCWVCSQILVLQAESIQEGAEIKGILTS